jgi:hypothetical protein
MMICDACHWMTRPGCHKLGVDLEYFYKACEDGRMCHTLLSLGS